MAEEKTEDQIRAEREAEAREANLRRNNERLDRLNAIANQADERKTEDGMEDLSEEAWVDPSGEKPLREAKPEEVILESNEDELDEARSAGADDVKVTNGETHYRLIVNGHERWLTLQQLRETSSKVSAADEYLKTAKEAVKSSISAAPSFQDESASLAKGRTRELLNRALMGEQEAIDELAQAIERPSAHADVARLVDERVDGRLTFRDAVSWFDKEYENELKDPRLKEYMVWKDSQMAQSNPDLDFKARLRAVGEEARALKGATGQVRDDSNRVAKEQRKASVRAIPQAGGRQVEAVEDEEDETYESAIARMAKSRGQARPISHSKR